MKTSTSKYEKDLQWLFYESESSFGIKSNFDTFIQACKYSMSHQSVEDTKSFVEMLESSTSTMDILDAVRKERKIMSVYSQLDSKYQQIFEAYYEQRQYSDALKDFGPGAGCIPFTNTGKHLTRLFLSNPTSFNVKQYNDAKVKLRKEVDQLFTTALAVYVDIAQSIGQ